MLVQIYDPIYLLDKSLKTFITYSANFGIFNEKV